MTVFKYERFLARINKQPNGCWIWTGRIERNGYGKITYKNKGISIHRFSYEWYVGPIPEGLQIDHLCRVRACCNPAHLEAVTPRTNVLRGNTIVAANASKTHCLRGHPLSGENLYMNGARRVCVTCQKAASRIHRNTDLYRAKHAAYERARRSQ